MPPNELYPVPPARIRVRVPTGPHDLVFTWTAPSKPPYRLGCVCTEDTIGIGFNASLDRVWELWFTELEHDPAAGPVRKPQPNAQRSLAS